METIIMTTQLIPVLAGEIAGQSVQLVDARLLHSFLEVADRFRNWISKRIEEYGFSEDQDFRLFLSESKGGRPSKEYHLTIDMAKELGMIERSEKGRQVRRYFLEMERVAHQSQYGLKQLQSPRAKRHVKGGLELLQQDAINDFIKARMQTVPQSRRAAMSLRIYSAINSKFGVTGTKDGYKNIAPEHFDSIMQLIARIPLEGDNLLTFTEEDFNALVAEKFKAVEGELMEKSSDADVSKQIKKLTQEVDFLQREHQRLSGELDKCLVVDLSANEMLERINLKFKTRGYSNGRWTVMLSDGEFVIKPMARGEFVTSSDRLQKLIADSMGQLVYREHLPGIIKAAAERLGNC